MATRKIERMDSITILQIGDCFMRATLDTRHGKEDPAFKYPVVITVYMRTDKKTYYRKLPYVFSKKDFRDLCKSTGKGRPASSAEGSQKTLSDIKADITEDFNSIADKLRDAAKRGPITSQQVLSLLGKKHSETFNDIWEEFNQTKSVGTRISYENARKSFLKIVGPVNRPYITAADIKTWEKGMEDLSKTTVGIYERACKAAWNETVRRRLASREDYPFGKIPQGAARKRDWLDTVKMTELYTIFINKRYPEEWPEAVASSVHRSIGLFLFQYLGNGCNMADVAQLRYNEDYVQSGGKMLTFVRQKTEDRSGTEVVIPITKPLRAILDDLAADPEKSATVFPDILRGITDPVKVKARVAQESKVVNGGLRRLTQYLQWTVRPSGTWARHSFATNLTHADVPERYISEAMGHAVSSVTSRYIDAYPLEQQMKYNSCLLDIQPTEPAKESVSISLEEYQRLLKIEQESKTRH